MATHFRTYDQVGKAEDISDVISTLTPTKVPFQTLIGRDTVDNTIYQWQEDELSAVAANAVLEGADASDSDMSPTVMRSNHTQIMQKTVKVSATADRVKTYGRAKETAYQVAKKSAELKREMEYHLIGIEQDAVAGSSAVARKFGNVFGADAAGTDMIHSSVTVDHTATPAALSESDILTVNQALYEAGAEAKYIMVKPADALIVAGFAAASGRSREINNGQSDRAIINAVDLYVSPFGEQKVIINRFLKADRALVFDPANWKLCTLRPWTRTLLAKTGDADRHQIVGEFGLKHVNYKATGQIKGLTGTNPTLP